MTFIAYEWTTPLSFDSSLIPVLLGLPPSDVCFPSTVSPVHYCSSARQPSNRSVTSMERIFSSRVDIISMYAEKGRKLLMKTDGRMIATEDEEIRSLKEKIKRNARIQREMEEHINEERGFVERIPLLSHRMKMDHLANPDVLTRVPLRTPYKTSENTAEAINRDLQLLSNKLNQVDMHLKNLDVGNLSVNNSEDGFTEEIAPDLRSMSTGRSDEREEELDLNYEETAAAMGPMPEIDKLDLSLLSPSVDVRRQIITGEHPNLIKSSPQRVLTQPEWMRLIPIGETNSSRLPLLQYSPPKQRESKTERSTQTDAFRSVSSKTVSTTDDEGNPADSGFLDSRSPKKRIEIIQPMSRENIQELLSQM
uniref:Microphthalmia-associated transcription factor n=1 Tax=Angiostrongylus cantonensis TaxID=6313 RepID=A0A0K0D6R9_ANGCA